jgi:hypothetical protein
VADILHMRSEVTDSGPADIELWTVFRMFSNYTRIVGSPNFQIMSNKFSRKWNVASLLNTILGENVCGP